MMPIIAGLVPIAASIALGWTVRRTGLIPTELWSGITRLSYLVLLPALLYVTIARADVGSLPAAPMLFTATAGFFAIAGLALLLKPILRTDNPSYTSVFQGSVRWNGFVILALAQTSLTPDQATLTALVFAPTVPLINVMCVAILSVWGANGDGIRIDRVLFRIVTNPLIIGCAAGTLASQVPPMRAPLIIETLELIGRAALPLILLTVGAGLNFSAIGARPGLLGIAVFMKLVAAPALFIALAMGFGLAPDVVVILAAIGAAPGAASSYVLARELGGNADLTAGHVTVTTILAFVSLPLWISAATVLAHQ